MKSLLSGLFMTLLIFSCNYRNQELGSITHFIPEDARMIIRINDLESFKSDLETNEIISRISYLRELNDDIAILRHIETISPILITLDTDTKDYTLFTKFNDSLFPNSQLDSIGIHHQVVDSVFMASSSEPNGIMTSTGPKTSSRAIVISISILAPAAPRCMSRLSSNSRTLKTQGATSQSTSPSIRTVSSGWPPVLAYAGAFRGKPWLLRNAPLVCMASSTSVSRSPRWRSRSAVRAHPR